MNLWQCRNSYQNRRGRKRHPGRVHPRLFWGHIDLYGQRFNGFWYNQDGTELTVNSDTMVNAFKWEQQFYCDGITPQQMLDLVATGGDYMAAEQLFYAGKTAFQVDGEWQVGPTSSRRSRQV